jgi:hypothetical protein
MADFRFEIFNQTWVTWHIFGIVVHAPKANPARRNTKCINMPCVIPTLPISLAKKAKEGIVPGTWVPGSLQKSLSFE